MEVYQRKTYERLGPHDQIEGFEYGKGLKIKRRRKREKFP